MVTNLIGATQIASRDDEIRQNDTSMYYQELESPMTES
jgi:hypothetical protein